jgi:hypothetical protein
MKSEAILHPTGRENLAMILQHYQLIFLLALPTPQVSHLHVATDRPALTAPEQDNLVVSNVARIGHDRI